MGIDAKNVTVFIWKILRFSMETTCRYARKYPVVSGVSVFIFLLYVFLPSVFYFLFYASPIIVCATFYSRNHTSLKPLKIDNPLKEKKTNNGLSWFVQKGSVLGKVRSEKPYLRPQRSVRRNARRKVEEVGKDWDSSQASEDEKDKVILTTLYGELPDRKTADFEEFMKEKTLLVSEDNSFMHSGESSPCNTENAVADPLEKLTGGGGETEVESLDEDDEEEEEETHEDKNKAVRWTEDDQKNLMDLGISEIERNKRLENLIARRQARRLFLLAAERSLMDIEIPPIYVGRNYSVLDQSNYEADRLQMPGSAPSVLLPTRNPFDLPYDPQEEKPNLTSDSFHQEFAVANKKEIFFCHHESFRHDHFPSENLQGTQWEPYSIAEKRAVNGLGFSQLGPQQDVCSNNRLVEHQQPLNVENDLTNGTNNKLTKETMENSHDMKSDSAHTSEVCIETDSIRNDDNKSNSSRSPRGSEDFSAVNQVDTFGTFYKRNNGERKYPIGLGDHIRNSLVGLAPRHNGSSSLATERQRYMEHFGYNTSKCHMVTHSMDSDLQVEVSETGSPPTTIDGNESSDEEKSLFVYESDVGMEMCFSSEEIETKPKNAINTFVKSEMSTMEKGQQDFKEISSSVSPKNKVPGRFEGPSDLTGVHCRFLKDDRQKPRELQVECLSTSSNILPPEISSKESHVTKEPAVPYPDEIISKIVEELQKIPQKSADEIKITYDLDEPEPSEKIDQESEEHGEKNRKKESVQEMKDEENTNEEIVESEVSDVYHGNSDESVSSNQPVEEFAGQVSPIPSTSSSPRSVLLDALSVNQTYASNFEDWEHTSDDQLEVGNAAPESLSSQPTSERNIEHSEDTPDSAMKLCEESKVANGVDVSEIIETSHAEKSKSTESSEDQLHAKEIIVAAESKPAKHENVVDYSEQMVAQGELERMINDQNASEIAKERDVFINPLAEELKNDQMGTTEEREHKPSEPFPQFSNCDGEESAKSHQIINKENSNHVDYETTTEQPNQSSGVNVTTDFGSSDGNQNQEKCKTDSRVKLHSKAHSS